MKKSNPVHPNHYKHIKINGKTIEVIDLIKAILKSGNYSSIEGADLFNALKYILGYPYKGHPTVDIDTAIYYLTDLRDYLGNDTDKPKNNQNSSLSLDDLIDKTAKKLQNYLSNVSLPTDGVKVNLKDDQDSDNDSLDQINSFLSKVINDYSDNNTNSSDKENTFDTGKFAVIDEDHNYYSTIKDKVNGLNEHNLLDTLNGKVSLDTTNLNDYIVFSDNFTGYFKLRFKLQEVEEDEEFVVTMHVFYDQDQLKNGKDNATKLLYTSLKHSVPDKYYDYVLEDKDDYMMDISETITKALKDPKKV